MHEAPRDRDHHVLGVIVRLVVFRDRVATHRGDGVLRTRDLAPEWVAREQGVREEIVDEVVGRVVTHPNLLEDHLTLRLDLFAAESRRPHDVGQDLQSKGKVAIGHPHVELRELLARRRVHVATDRFDGLGDLERVAPVGALEQQMLEEVARTRQFVGLVARTRGDPEADRDRAQGRESFGDDPQSGLEARAVESGCVFEHCVRHRP